MAIHLVPDTPESFMESIPPTLSPLTMASLESTTQRRDGFLAVLESLRPTLTERDKTVLDRVLSSNVDETSVFNALISEGIIRPSQLPQLGTFSSVEDVSSESEASDVQHSSSTKVKTSKNPVKLVPETKASHTSVKKWMENVYKEYVLESNRPELVVIIKSIAQSARAKGMSITEMEKTLIDLGLLTAKDIEKVRERFAIKRRKKEKTVAETKTSTLTHAISDPKTSTGLKTPGQYSRPTNDYPTLPTSTATTDIPRISTNPPLRLSDMRGPSSAPSAPKVAAVPIITNQRRAAIAQALPRGRGEVNLIPTILSWPEDQIARKILMAAGRPIPNEEAMPLNSDLDVIRNSWPQLGTAELTTLKWDLVDPPKVDVATAIKEKLAVTRRGRPRNVDRPRSVNNTKQVNQTRPKISLDSVANAPFVVRKWRPVTISWASSKLGTSSIVQKALKKQPINVNLPNFTDNQHSSSSTSNLADTILLPPQLPQPTQSMPQPSATYFGISVTGTARPADTQKKGEPGSVTAIEPNPPDSDSKNTSRRTLPQVVHKSDNDSPNPEPPKAFIQSAQSTPGKMLPQVVITSPSPRRSAPPPAVVRHDNNDLITTPSKRTSLQQSMISPSSPDKRSKPSNPHFNDADLTTIASTTPPNTANHSGQELPSSSTKFSSQKPVKMLEKYKSYPCRWRACHTNLPSFGALEQHILKVHGKPDPRTKVFPTYFETHDRL